jgi:hypothetical protein
MIDYIKVLKAQDWSDLLNKLYRHWSCDGIGASKQTDVGIFVFKKANHNYY